jgi:hypothetical protein
MAGVVLRYVSVTPEPRPQLPKVHTPSFHLSPEELQACKALHITPQSLRSLPKPEHLQISTKRWEDIEAKRRDRLRLVRREVERRRKISPEMVEIEGNQGRGRPGEQVDLLTERISGLMKNSVMYKGVRREGGKEMKRRRREIMTEQEELERRRREIVGKIRGVRTRQHLLRRSNSFSLASKSTLTSSSHSKSPQLSPSLPNCSDSLQSAGKINKLRRRLGDPSRKFSLEPIREYNGQKKPITRIKTLPDTASRGEMLPPAAQSLYGNSTNPVVHVPAATEGLQISLLQGYKANEQERLLQKWKIAERSLSEIKSREDFRVFDRKESS